MLTAADFRPPRWLRNAHLQTVLGSSGMRQWMGEHQLAATGAITTAHLLDGGNGVRLQGLHSAMPGAEGQGMAILLHGWEGSADSGYMRLTAASLLEKGFEVFRLNFRDHGGTHHLNSGLFHSNRIDEVVHATADIARRFPLRPLTVGGYSLGGNFALRLALRAPTAGLAITRVAVICPLLDPARTMDAMETGMPAYMRHFEGKWRRSLQRKRELFPQQYDFDDRVLGLRMRPLTRWMVERSTDYDSLESYFDGYSLAGDRLARLEVPASILMAADDPVIPVEDFASASLSPCVDLQISPWGGHCGFLENGRLQGFGEQWLAQRLAACADTMAD